MPDQILLTALGWALDLLIAGLALAALRRPHGRTLAGRGRHSPEQASTATPPSTSPATSARMHDARYGGQDLTDGTPR